MWRFVLLIREVISKEDKSINESNNKNFTQSIIARKSVKINPKSLQALK